MNWPIILILCLTSHPGDTMGFHYGPSCRTVSSPTEAAFEAYHNDKTGEALHHFTMATLYKVDVEKKTVEVVKIPKIEIK